MSLNRWVALCFLLLSLVYGYAAYNYPLLPFERNMTFLPNTMPVVLSAFGILFSLILLFAPRKTGDDDAQPVVFIRQYVVQAVLLILAMIAFAVLIRPLGFILSTSLFLVAGGWILGERRPVKMVIIAFFAALCIWLLVQEVLGIFLKPLPL